MRSATLGRLTLTLAALGLAACGNAIGTVGGGATSPVAQTTPVAAAPTATAAPTTAPTVPPVSSVAPTAKPAAPPATTVVMTATTSQGMALTAASNGRTLYTFNSDRANSGMTNCNAGCVDEWPPLTVAAGAVLGAGSGVTGHLGHIVRTDGRVQVTDNGMPLYFFSGDSGPGQTHGNYPGWSIARP